MNRRTFFRDVLASAALAWGAPLVAMAEVAEVAPAHTQEWRPDEPFPREPFQDRFGAKGSNLIVSSNPITMEEMAFDLRRGLERFISAIEGAK